MDLCWRSRRRFRAFENRSLLVTLKMENKTKQNKTEPRNHFYSWRDSPENHTCSMWNKRWYILLNIIQILTYVERTQLQRLQTDDLVAWSRIMTAFSRGVPVPDPRSIIQISKVTISMWALISCHRFGSIIRPKPQHDSTCKRPSASKVVIREISQNRNNWTQKTTPGGGHLYFRLDIIRVKGLSKHTLNTYFAGMKIDPKYAFLHAFFFNLSVMSFPKFVIWPKPYPFFQFYTFLHP